MMSYKDGYTIRKEYGNDAESVFLGFCRDQNIPYGKFGVEPYQRIQMDILINLKLLPDG